MGNVIIKWVILTVVLLGTWLWVQMPDGKLRLVFCDVGQGDGALVIRGYFQALIDTGQDEAKILKCLSDFVPFWDRRLEAVFVSHRNRDHNGALEKIKKVYEVEREVINSQNGDILRYGDLWFEILYGGGGGGVGEKKGCENENDCSQVVRVTLGNFSGLFTGDMGISEELALIAEGVIKKTDVLKVAHHGSKYSSSMEFLQAVSPELAVISVGRKNSYGHPTEDTLMRLDAVGVKIMRTDILGTIEVVTDGEKIWTVKK